MGSRYEGALVSADTATIETLPARLLTVAAILRPRIRMTVVATRISGGSDLWWIALVGINKKPLQVETEIASVPARSRAMKVPLVWAKHMALSATYAAAVRVAGLIEATTYVFYSNSRASLAVRFRSGRPETTWDGLELRTTAPPLVRPSRNGCPAYASSMT